MKVAEIRSPWPDAPQRWLATTSSTMDEAGSLQRQGAPHGTLVVADYQRAGRGRKGRTWVSARGQNLLFSLLLDARRAPEPALLPLVVGVAVAAAIDRLVAQFRPRDREVRPQVKWPNDVVIAGHKVAGALCDRRGDLVMVGVGVTCNQRRGLPAGPYPARSLRQLLGVRVDRWALLERILGLLHDGLGADSPDSAEGRLSAVSSIEPWLYGAGLEVSIDEAPRGLPDRGTVVGIADDGALRVRDAGGRIHPYYSGRLLPATTPPALSSRT